MRTLAMRAHYETVLDIDRARRLARAKIDAAPLTALDTETDSLDPMRARIVGISFAVAGRGGLRAAAPRLCRRARPAAADAVLARC
jgi:DNA polymerase I-like protein with 3'-5' exonuclease and polymerase domains